MNKSTLKALDVSKLVIDKLNLSLGDEFDRQICVLAGKSVNLSSLKKEIDALLALKAEVLSKKLVDTIKMSIQG